MGFRYAAQREALRLGLRGRVRNLGDGDVEVDAEGERVALATFREWLEEGPPGAWVRSTSVEMRTPTGRFMEFSIE